MLIINGQNNHHWKATTPVLKQAFEKSGRFEVVVATGPAKPSLSKKKDKDEDAAILAKYKADLEKFRPDLSQCDVVLSNYNGDPWSKAFQKDLDDKVRAGKVGLVVFHAANNAFTGWPEFNRMIGMGCSSGCVSARSAQEGSVAA